MLSLFASTAFSYGEAISFCDGWNPNAAFDITYGDFNHDQAVSQQGFHVNFRYYDDNGELQYLLPAVKWKQPTMILTNSGKQIAKISWDKNAKYDGSKKFLPIKFTVTNLQTTKPLLYDLGVFADIRFFKDDKAPTVWAIQNAAIRITKKGLANKGIIFGLKGTQFPDVDTIFMGPLKIEGRGLGEMPFWSNETHEFKEGDDTNFAFAWRNRTLRAEQSEDLGIIAVTTREIQRRPIVEDIQKKTELQEDFIVKIPVKYYDAKDEWVDVKLQVGNANPMTKSVVLNAETGKIQKTAVFRVHMPAATAQYTLWATTRNGNIESYQKFRGTLLREGYKPPTITFTETPASTYFAGQEIFIQGTAKDEQEVTIKYKFDDGADKNFPPVSTIENGTYQFSFKIPMNTELQRDKTHSITVWAEDPLGQPSQKRRFEFTLKTPKFAIINSVFASETKVLPGTRIIIFGDLLDYDSQNISVWAYWNKEDDENPKQLGIYNNSNFSNTIPFEGFYDVPEGLEPGRYHIYLEPRDSENTTGSEKVKLGITIVSRDPPDPAKIARIFEGDKNNAKVSSDACFTLHYQKDKETPISLSNNDQGFFVALSVADENGYGWNRRVFVKKATQEAELDGVHVKYFKDVDPESNYFQAKFNITNNAYYDRQFELGMFVDSKFGSHEQIELRDDRRGFIVSDEEQDIYYTVFTTYRNYPVATYNINPLWEPSFGYGVNDLPFFSEDYEDTPLYIGTDPMYNVYWKGKGKKVKPGETVTYTLTFAGFDYLRTPSHVVLDYYDPDKPFYEKNTQVSLRLRILDENIGETVNYQYNLNGHKEAPEQFNVTTDPKVLMKPINLGNGPFFDFTLVVWDVVSRLPTEFHKRFVVSKPPTVTFNIDRIKRDVVHDDAIEISGRVFDEEDNISIMLTFADGAKEELVGKVTSSGSQQPFNLSYTIPRDLRAAQDYTLRLWAVDKYGLPSTQQTKLITIHARDYPVLSRAGFSKKICKAGEKILGYVAVQDSQIGERMFMEIWVKFGNDAEWQFVKKYKNEWTDRHPYAYYYDVPAGIPSGSYDVYVKVVDFTGLPSTEEKHNTILIVE